jgi:Beta/Gamma crystallin
VLLLSARRSAASIAATLMLTAMAPIASVTDAQAAQPNRPGMVQHAMPNRPVMVQHTTPFQHPAPAFHTPPVQRVAPVMPPSAPPVRVMPTFTQPQNNNNFQAVNPSVQHVNPSLPLNNPSALRPNLPLNNPSALAPNLPPNNPSTVGPNFPPNNPGALGPNFSPANPNFVHGGASAPQGPAIIKLGRSQPVVNSTLLKPAPGAFQQTKPVFPAVHVHDKFWPIHKDSKFMWVRGQRRLFVPVALLGVVVIGGSYWYPDGYVSMEGPACTGFTPDGCQLQWRMVDFEDGGGEPQCVQYCPQVGPLPEQVATLPPPPPTPPAENGACQTTIYAEPNFAGNTAPTGDSQPSLSQTGWRNEISSIVVGAGTWDFFSDENFGGESMRLTPGTYPTLSAEWTKRIGSFMCVQPGPPRA